MITRSRDLEKQAVETVAALMCAAARTAPKGRGIDNLVTLTVKAGTKDRLAAEMRDIAAKTGAKFFARDAGNVDDAPLVLLMGQKVQPSGVAPCGYCGFSDCAAAMKNNGRCAISISDLGIALSAAAQVAGLHHIDNRIMFSVGRAALNLDIFDEEVTIAYGIVLNVSGKNPFFDRK